MKKIILEIFLTQMDSISVINRRILAVDCENTPFWRKEWKDIYRNPFREMCVNLKKFTKKIAFTHALSMKPFVEDKLKEAGFIIKTSSANINNIPNKDAADKILIEYLYMDIIKYMKSDVNGNNLMEIYLITSDTELITKVIKDYINHPRIKWVIIWQTGKTSPYLLDIICIKNNVNTIVDIKNIKFYEWNPNEEKVCILSNLKNNIESINKKIQDHKIIKKDYVEYIYNIY